MTFQRPMNARERFQAAWAAASVIAKSPRNMQALSAKMGKWHLYFRRHGNTWLVIDASPSTEGRHVSMKAESLCADMGQVHVLRRLLWDYEDRTVEPMSVESLRAVFAMPSAHPTSR